MSLIIDTDMGVDDWMALVYLFSLDIDVSAITVSGTGLAHGPQGAENLWRFLRTIGRTDIPIAYGPDKTIGNGNHRFPEGGWGRQVTDEIANDIAGHLVAGSAPGSFNNDAPGVLSKALGSNTCDVIAIGPLTNLALALQRDPGVIGNIRSLTIMGGAIDVPGNVPSSPTAEFNIWVDPEAAQMILNCSELSGRIQLVSLDLTNQVPLTTAFRDAACQQQANFQYSGSQIVCSLLNLPWIAPSVEAGEYFFWDSLAAAVATGSVPGVTSRSSWMSVDPFSGKIEAHDAPGGQGVTWYASYDPGSDPFPGMYLEAITGMQGVS